MKSTTLTIRIPKDEKAALEKCAKDELLTATAFVRRAVRMYIQVCLKARPQP